MSKNSTLAERFYEYYLMFEHRFQFYNAYKRNELSVHSFFYLISCFILDCTAFDFNLFYSNRIRMSFAYGHCSLECKRNLFLLFQYIVVTLKVLQMQILNVTHGNQIAIV